MPKIMIPTVGTLLTLSRPWRFALHRERRNQKVWDILAGQLPDWYSQFRRCRIEVYIPAVLPKGTVLSVDRIYIRQNMPKFDSVSFRIKECPDKRLEKKRFWAKLLDVNHMEAEWDEATLPRRATVEDLPEEVTVPPSELYYLKERIPQEIRTPVIVQYRIDKKDRHPEYVVKLRRDVIHIFELEDGVEREIWVETPQEAE